MITNQDHFADRLEAAIRRTGSPLCLGLDPFLALLPPHLHSLPAPQAIGRLSCEILEALSPYLPAVKIQSACFERIGRAGMAVLEDTVRLAHRLGLLVILDAKRGDIGSTAQEYADAYLDPDGPFNVDAITLSPYLGWDSLEPFARFFSLGKGAFVLVRTSNPSAGQLQNLVTEGIPLYRRVGQLVSTWGIPFRGKNGYSALGAVVAATYPEETGLLRSELPHTLFLVPGYGAQGASEREVSLAFNEGGGGALVNSSRAILYAYRQSGRPSEQYLQASLDAYHQAVQRLQKAIAERTTTK